MIFCWNIHDFEVSKNLVKYKSENNFIINYFKLFIKLILLFY